MAGVDQTEMDAASDAVITAHEEINSCESQVNSYSDKVQHCNFLICQDQRDIAAADK